MDRAVEARLKGLSFAASSDGQVLVWGDPLPSVQGAYFVLDEGLALPLGWELSLPVGGEVVRKALALDEGEFAVMHDDRQIDRLCRDDFLALTRSAVRLTVERLATRPSAEVVE